MNRGKTELRSLFESISYTFSDEVRALWCGGTTFLKSRFGTRN